MHRTFPLALVAFALMLAACGGDSKGSTTTTPQRGATIAAASTPATVVATQTPGGAERTAVAVVTAASAADAEKTSTAVASPLKLTSDAFADGGLIPVKYTCIGDKVSPALSWSGAPPNTQEYALIVDDPDAPLASGVTHWVVYALPASVTKLPAAVPAGPDIVGGGKQGLNVSGATAFTPPCPPIGVSPHHYRFHLYALDAPLGLDAGKTNREVTAAVQGHITAETTLVGLFGR